MQGLAFPGGQNPLGFFIPTQRPRLGMGTQEGWLSHAQPAAGCQLLTLHTRAQSGKGPACILQVKSLALGSSPAGEMLLVNKLGTWGTPRCRAA